MYKLAEEYPSGVFSSKGPTGDKKETNKVHLTLILLKIMHSLTEDFRDWLKTQNGD